MNPKICVSISPKDTSELIESVQRAESLSADLVEVRFDKLRNYHGTPKIAQHVGIPLIATNRAVSANGSFEGPEKERLQVLIDAVDEGFQYVDLESTTDRLENVLETFREKNAKIILSNHDYVRTPDQSKLNSTLTKLWKNKPDICKLVTTATTAIDNLTILNVLKENHETMPLLCVAMGKEGVWSRLLAPFYGAPFTYASLERGLETAPGQPAISELRQIYDILGRE